MRKMIAGMKTSLDGKMEGPSGDADWVKAWSDDYGVMEEVDACLLGGGMYPGYEAYWTAIQTDPSQPAINDGHTPTPAEVAYAGFVARTPHFVLSNTLGPGLWPGTRFVRSLAELAALKAQPGKSIYLVGGARTTSSLIDAGLVDELRLIVYPLIAGAGKALFATTERRRALELRRVEEISNGRVMQVFGVAG